MNQNYFEALKQVESGGNPLAVNEKTSAKGLYQFINSTGEAYGLNKYQFGTPEYTKAEEDAVRRFTSDNYASLKKSLGREPTSGELYLAHQQGAGNALKMLSSDENAKAIDILGVDQVLNNGGNEKMTIGEFKRKWTSKFDKESAQEKGLTAAPVEFDALKDFGNTERDIDAISDFRAAPQDLFLDASDGVGGIKKSMIDQTTGAPAYIRQVVGSLTDPESRLETMRKYYPDAQPFEDGNFIFKNPETGKLTLYNPSGLDWGDVASVTKDAFVTVGSGIGATIGAGGGLVASAPTLGTSSPATVPAGAVVGAGLGAGISSNLFDLWMTLSGQTRDIRTPVKRVAETSIDVAGSAIGEGIGRAVPTALKESIGGAKAVSRAIVRQMEKYNITPTIGVTMKGFGGRLESGLSQNIVSAELMQKQVDTVIDESHQALKNIVKRYGTARTKQGAGGVIVEAAESAAKRAGDKISKLYDDAFNLVGRGTIVDIDSTKMLYNDMVGEITKAPQSRGSVYSKAVKTMQAMLSDAENGIDFETLRAIRTDIGRDLQDPLTSGATSSQNAAMKRVYAALTTDMQKAAEAAGPAAKKAIGRADTYKRAYETTAAKTLNKIMKFDAEEKAYKFAIAASKDGGSSLSKLRKLFTDDEWGDVSATVLSQLGENVDGSFSVNRFVTNYEKLAPEAKDALFRGGRYKDAADALDGFVDIMGMLKDAGRYQNTSNTAGAIQTNLIVTQLMGASMGAAGGFLTGEQTGLGGVPGAIGGLIAPRVAARLITNKAFVKWLAQPVSEGAQEASAHFARLIIIGKENPEIKEDIDQLIQAMERTTAK